MEKYLLITANEDGGYLSFSDERDLMKLLADPRSTHGVDDFFHVQPKNQPPYWTERQGLLLRVELMRPVQSESFVLSEDID